MEAPPPLPLPLDALPEGLRRFADPAGPAPARMMAARGALPVSGADMVTLLAQLSADADEAVAAAARQSLGKLPENVVVPACDAALHPSILDALVDYVSLPAALERLAANDATADSTMARLAARADEMLGERIATNEERLLRAPRIIEALYKNKRVRMSTCDRLVDLAARNGVEVSGIPGFAAAVEAVKGQLIPEPGDEPLPSDAAFVETMEQATDDHEVVERDDETGDEKLKKAYLPLAMQISRMTKSEKIRATLVGGASARALLVRDPDRAIAAAAINAPGTTVAEANAIAHSKEVGEDVLRMIANRTEWMRGQEIKRALVFNPKTPVGVSLRFLSFMKENDLKVLARSRGIPQPVKTAASQRIESMEKSRRGPQKK